MLTEGALVAYWDNPAGAPTGLRRLTPGLLAADHLAEDFDGLPDGVTGPGQILAALKAAAPRLGPRLVHAVDRCVSSELLPGTRNDPLIIRLCLLGGW